MARPVFRMSLAFVLVSLIAGVAFTQQPEPDRYVAVTYIKVLPGQGEAYRAHLATNAKKFYKELMATNANVLTWSAARAMYQGMEHGNDFDYVAATVFAGSPPEPGANMDAVFQKAVGMSQAEYGQKLTAMRTVVGTEVLRRRAGTTGPGAFKEGDFRVVARIRVTPGMGDEYIAMAQTMTQPLMQARVAGGELKGWSMWSRVFPAGAGTSYDAMTVTHWKDLASAIRGLDPAKGLEAFAKAHPGKNYATFINNGADYSQLQQRNIMQVVALVER
jgi:hypothetical protein